MNTPKFEDFIKLTQPGVDISRFKDDFGFMLDVNGAVPAYTIGFSFALDDDAETAHAQDLFKTFSPTVLYVGSVSLQARLMALGRQAVVFPYFEGGGFAVVLKVPA